MVKESCSAEVVVVPKFDMQCHESLMTAKDVKSLARKYNVPLDLHPCAPTEGWTMDKFPEEVIGLYEQFLSFLGKNVRGKIFNETFSGMKGWKDRFFFIDRRAIPDAMTWRHHDSDAYDAFPDNDFSIQDVSTLTKRIIDLRPVPLGLLFGAGLATTWDFPGFFPVLKDTGENVVTIQLEVEVEDPKVIASIEKKKAQAARAVAKKKER
ncbi:hypothetical protein Tco_1252764 [Tanacetum coccineum]